MGNCGCIIVGAGPAGLSAAMAAARGGQSVVVLEKNGRAGLKLLLAGGGRANVMDPARAGVEALEAFGRSGRFLRQSLGAFRLGEFLKELGVEIEREDEGLRKGSIYVRGGARHLRDAMLREAEKRGVEMVFGAAVSSAARRAEGGFEVRAGQLDWRCSRLIIATGGITYPATGCSGDGYRLANILGHEVETPRPALSALVTEPSWPNLAGVSVAEAAMTLRRAGRKLASRRGALLFTHQGVSGPAALDLSLELARALPSAEEVCGSELVADLCPDKSGEQLIEEFLAASRARPKRRLENAGLMGMLSGRLVVELAGRAGIDAGRQMGQISRREFAALAGNVKALTLIIGEPLDPEEAMVTVGGVVTNKLDPYTMESRISPGLRFAGEVLAPAGPCGGYNLLMAFATGYAAGGGD